MLDDKFRVYTTVDCFATDDGGFSWPTGRRGKVIEAYRLGYNEVPCDRRLAEQMSQLKLLENESSENE